MDHDAKHHGMQGSTENPGVMHESSDADTVLILKFGFWLAILTIACAIAVFPLMKGFEWMIATPQQDSMMQAIAHPDPSPNPMVPAEKRDMPPVKAVESFPQPRLQADTPGDLNRYRAWQREQEESYQVLDAAQGTVRVPVSRAMELTLQRGLSARTPVSEAPVPVKK